MKHSSGTGSSSRALAKKPPLAVVALGDGASHEAAHDAASAHEERVREVAYGLYEARGRADGHDLEDWLQAEAAVQQAPADLSASQAGH